MLTFRDFRRANSLRCVDAFHPIDSWSETDWATAVAGEVGEACNFVKKLRRIEGDNTPAAALERRRLRHEIMKELADVVTYADLLAARIGGSLEEAVISKFNEVSDRRGSKIKLPTADDQPPIAAAIEVLEVDRWEAEGGH